MQAGRLSTLVTIQQKTAGVDAIGQPLPENWTTLRQEWANVRHQSGAEAIKAGAVVSVVQASIRVRWCTDLTAGMRVLAGGVVYEITAVLPDLAKRVHVDLVAQVVE